MNILQLCRTNQEVLCLSTLGIWVMSSETVLLIESFSALSAHTVTWGSV